MQVTADDRERPWDEAGVFQVADDLYRIPLPLPDRGLRAVNVYAISGPDGQHLIDSGQATDDARAALLAALDALGAGPADIRDISTTHVHVDHYTQGPALRRDHPIRILLGERERANLELAADPGRHHNSRQVELLRRSGATRLADLVLSRRRTAEAAAQWEGPDEWLGDGSELSVASRILTVLHTPGHTSGHVVFHDSRHRMMFSGDHVLPRITPSIGLEPLPPSRPLADFMSSLHRVRSIPDALMLPAHGPVTDGVHARVDALLRHHEVRLTAAENRLRHGDATALEVAGNLTWTRHEKHLGELDDFNQMLAILETAAHLDVLTDQGRATVTDGEPAVYAIA